jgi:RNA polymerase sigma-70 factor (ECF subfamily)
MQDEKELIKQAKAGCETGDFRAFGQLYEKYFDKIYSYVVSMTKNHEAAEDVVSITFEKAIENISSYEDRGYSFGAWLYRIARNETMDYFKKENKVTRFEESEVLISRGNVSYNKGEELVLQEKLWKQIEKLDDYNKEVIVLRYIEGYSIKETAKILEKTEDAIKSAAKRAMKDLRKNMKN